MQQQQRIGDIVMNCCYNTGEGIVSNQRNDWFTVENIDPDTFVISEYKHWEEPHCYLVCGRERAALIDTGLGVANIKAIVDTLTSLPILVLTTHAHWDHIGGHRQFHHIAVHEKEQDWLNHFPIPLAVVKQNLMRHPCAFPQDFDINSYHIFQGQPQILLHDGDTLDLGNRSLTVVHTPGHSPGHCCFYEADRGYLFSGDLIYRGCLDAFYPTTDPVQFSNSINKVQLLDIAKILPGHHQLHVPVHIVEDIQNAFGWLKKTDQQKQGCGVFDFGLFSIHL